MTIEGFACHNEDMAQPNKHHKNKKKTYMITEMKSVKYQVKQFSRYCE